MLRPADFAAPREPLPAWVAAAVMHLVAAAATLMLAARAPELAPATAWYWVEGLAAAALGAIAGLPSWWLPINFLFVPALHALLEWQIPALFYLGVFCILFAFNVAAWRHRVPLFLSSAKVTTALLPLLPRHSGFRLLDLGCGTGTLLDAVAGRRPDGDYHGVEIAPLSFLASWWRARARATVRVTWGDFWDADFARYDVVYAYLSPVPMARLWEKARREMRPGSLLVSNTFAIPGAPPAHTVPVGDRMHSMLYAWRM